MLFKKIIERILDNHFITKMKLFDKEISNVTEELKRLEDTIKSNYLIM